MTAAESGHIGEASSPALVDDDVAAWRATRSVGEPGDDRPPACPVCHRRLVILSSRLARDDTGELRRRQLWGCPLGHATSYRVGGVFHAVEVLPEIE